MSQNKESSLGTLRGEDSGKVGKIGFLQANSVENELSEHACAPCECVFIHAFVKKRRV